MMRVLVSTTAGLVVAVALFYLMLWLVLPPEAGVPDRGQREAIAIAPPPPDEPESQEAAAQQLAEAPPQPPSVPSISLNLAASMPVPAVAPQAVPTFSVPKLTTSGGSLSSGGSFGGFAAGAGSGAGYGQGKGFKGGKLVPLSTARPQIPQWAFERGIEGWVEVVFLVMPNGRVENVRIIDAEPKGVFEAAMVASIQNWIYPSSRATREVKQRFEFKLDDYQYNWN